MGFQKDKDALDGISYAIEALACLDVNKKQNGGIGTMSDKVKVTIEMPDGFKKEFSGDTVICFTVEQAKEFLNGSAKMVTANAVHMGMEIPAPIFAPTIGRLISEVIERNPSSRDKITRAYNLHEVSKILEAKSRKLRDDATPEEIESALQDALKNLFETLRR